MNKNPVVTTIACVVGAIFGYVAVAYFFQSRQSAGFDHAIVRVASELNKNLPMMVDKATRLDTTIPGPGEKLTYAYTLITTEKNSLDAATLEQRLRPQMISNYKNSKQMKSFREHNVELDYQYKDKNGESLFTIAVSPKDF